MLLIDKIRKKKLDRSNKKFLKSISKTFFVPIRPTLLEIRRDKLEIIKKNIKIK